MSKVYQQIAADKDVINISSHFMCDNCLKDYHSKAADEIDSPKDWIRVHSDGDKVFNYPPVTLHFCTAKCEAAFRKKRSS